MALPCSRLRLSRQASRPFLSRNRLRAIPPRRPQRRCNPLSPPRPPLGRLLLAKAQPDPSRVSPRIPTSRSISSSDVLLVHDSQKTATFKGNVKAVQGTTILYSKELEVHYAGGGSESLTGAPGAKPSTVASTDPATATPEAAKPPAAGDKSGMALGDNGTKITRIYARGDVVINSDQDQTTTGDLADYDVPGQMVTVSGNVVLTQGKNVLKGDRLVINLTTGESRFDPGTANSAKPARIKAIFQKQEAASGDDASNKDKPAEKTGNATPDDGSSGATKGAEASLPPLIPRLKGNRRRMNPLSKRPQPSRPLGRMTPRHGSLCLAICNRSALFLVPAGGDLN